MGTVLDSKRSAISRLLHSLLSSKSTVAVLAVLLFLFSTLDFWQWIRSLVAIIKVARMPRKRSIFDVSEIKSRVMPTDLDWLLHMNNSKYLRDLDFGRVDFWGGNGAYEKIRQFKWYFVLGAMSIRYRRELNLFQVLCSRSAVLFCFILFLFLSCLRFNSISSVTFLQPYTISTRLLCWDDTSFYLEQRFVGKRGFVHAIAIAKQTLVGRDATVDKVLKILGHEGELRYLLALLLLSCDCCSVLLVFVCSYLPHLKMADCTLCVCVCVYVSPSIPEDVRLWVESQRVSSNELRREAGLPPQ